MLRAGALVDRVLRFIDNGARTFTLNTAQTLVVSQLATNDSSGSKYFVRLRAADNGLLGPIAILIVLVRVLGFGAERWLRRIRFSRGNKSSGFREVPRPGIRPHDHSFTL